MVQIRRQHAAGAHPRRLGGGVRNNVCLPTVAVSALVPLLFWLRGAWFSYFSSSQHDHNDAATTTIRRKHNPDPAVQQPNQQHSTNPYVEYLQGLDFTSSKDLNLPGYLVELDYCDTSGINFTQFVARVEGSLLNATLMELQKQQQQRDSSLQDDDDNDDDETTAHEFLLQLLEQHLQREGRCDYSQYRPTVPASAVVVSTNTAGVLPPKSSSSSCPVVAVLSAFHDVAQLAALLQALVLDDTNKYNNNRLCVVVHLDALCGDEYRTAVLDAVDVLHDATITVLQFGSVVYRTDSLSLINMRILRWLTTGINAVDYQYVLLLDGSAFPLVSGRALVDALLLQQQQPSNNNNRRRRHVWLGALTHNGRDATGTAWDFRLERKQLVDTRRKRHKRLPKDAWGGDRDSDNNNDPRIPLHIREHLVHKTTSGNQAIYSRHVVQELLDADAVMELFALAKYGCCCCIEEHSWAAALSMIGLAPDDTFLQQPPMMFQAWGGETSECVGSMSNAVLSTNASLCFRSEDPIQNNISDNSNASAEQQQQQQQRPLYYRGDQMWEKLVDARRRGFFFARKFRSDRADSVQLRHDIQTELWGLPL